MSCDRALGARVGRREDTPALTVSLRIDRRSAERERHRQSLARDRGCASSRQASWGPRDLVPGCANVDAHVFSHHLAGGTGLPSVCAQASSGDNHARGQSLTENTPHWMPRSEALAWSTVQDTEGAALSRDGVGGQEPAGVLSWSELCSVDREQGLFRPTGWGTGWNRRETHLRWDRHSLHQPPKPCGAPSSDPTCMAAERSLQTPGVGTPTGWPGRRDTCGLCMRGPLSPVHHDFVFLVPRSWRPVVGDGVQI